MAKREVVKFRTAAGAAKYPKLDRAYSWSNTENRSIPDPDGQFELTVSFTPEDAKPIEAAVQQAIKLAGIEPKNLPFKRNEETGMIEVKFKAYGTRRDGSPNRVPQVDSAVNPLPGDFKLTSGSVVKVSGWISVAKLGCRLNMDGVQVLKYVPYEAKTQFEPENDGFVMEAPAEAPAEDLVFEGEGSDDTSLDF
jgi:hypothetical protein